MKSNKFNNLKEPYVLILVGPPLVGKSTFVRENFSNDDIVLISRDEIVLDLANTDDYNKAFNTVDQKKVNIELDLRLKEASSDGRNVIVDMTNLTSKRRKSNLNYFDDSYTKIAVIFPMLSEDEIKERNRKRVIEENKNIPESVIKNMISSYQSISPSEGFNKVISL